MAASTLTASATSLCGDCKSKSKAAHLPSSSSTTPTTCPILESASINDTTSTDRTTYRFIPNKSLAWITLLNVHDSIYCMDDIEVWEETESPKKWVVGKEHTFLIHDAKSTYKHQVEDCVQVFCLTNGSYQRISKKTKLVVTGKTINMRDEQCRFLLQET